jgi:transcriptional regulator with XRE-family HTH domain
VGLNIADLLHSPDASPQELLGYLATPLTGLSDELDEKLRILVKRIKELAGAEEFVDPRHNLYWPGDYTHPKRNPGFLPTQVYRIDRSRASAFDFVVLLCLAGSFGVGQENEIATQAGIPAIRLLPKGVSRMMSGSFLRAVDIFHSGSLATGIVFDEDAFLEALRSIKRTHFRHRALYRGVNGNDFKDRLRKLVNDRSGGYRDFAEDLGVHESYVAAMMEEPFTVSNPSARLLERMAVLLGVSVGYLLGETIDSDPVCIESTATWRAWVNKTPKLETGVVLKIRDDWQNQHLLERRQPPSLVSHRQVRAPMTEADWEKMYQAELGKRAKSAGLFSQQHV